MKFTDSITNRDLSRAIRVGFVVAFLLLSVGFVLSFYSYSRNNQDNGQVEHSYKVISTINEVISQTKDVESSIRGYVISGDKLFLEPYNTAIPKIKQQLDQLKELLKDNPSQLKRADTLVVLVKAKLDFAQRQVTHLNQPDERKYFTLDKVWMDRIRIQANEMIGVESSLRQVRNVNASQSFRTTVVIIFSLSLLTFLTLIISYNLLEKELDRRQRNEDQLRAYEAELTDKIRLLEVSNQELERFAFVASHDLQEPLRKIQAFGNLLSQRHEPLLDSEGTMFLSRMTQSAERMSKMIKDLLNFSRVSVSTMPEEFRWVQLNDIVNQILDDQELRMKSLGAQVEVSKLPTLQAIPSQMESLFSNLISNSLKFIEPGVSPVIKITTAPVGEAEFPEGVPGNKYFKILVSDNGIGFEEKYLDHIFKVFQRLHGKTAYDGTGIGLAICKKVVTFHKGHITAYSQLGEGATFVIILPQEQPQQIYDRPISDETHTHSLS